MDIKEWAKNEIELAMKAETKDMTDQEESAGMDEYVKLCYDSAMKALESLYGDVHSGMSIGLTISVLRRMIDRKPLTPITENDSWTKMEWGYGMEELWQCDRYPRLYKSVHVDGSVTYSDMDRVVGRAPCDEVCFGSSWCNHMIDHLYPIKLPYMPTTERYTMITDDFLSDEENGDFDHWAVLYVIKPSGFRVKVGKFYDLCGEEPVEISQEEYRKRRAKRVKMKTWRPCKDLPRYSVPVGEETAVAGEVAAE